MRDGYLRGALSPKATQRQTDVLAAYVAAGGSVTDAAELAGIRPSTVKRHLADLRARSSLTTEQLINLGRAEGWLAVPSLESDSRLGTTSRKTFPSTRSPRGGSGPPPPKNRDYSSATAGMTSRPMISSGVIRSTPTTQPRTVSMPMLDSQRS